MKKTGFKLKTIGHDGSSISFLEMPDTCICLYKNLKNKVLFVKQYRPIFDDFFIELPGGSNDKNESLDLTASREFREETGFIATDLKLILSVILSIGSTSEKAHIYKILDIDENISSKPEAGIEILWIDNKEIDQMIRDGLIVDAKTIVALKTVLD